MSAAAPVRDGQILTGSLFNEPMRVETVQANGPASWVVGLVGMQSERFRKVTLTADQFEHLTVLDPRHSFDGDGRLLRLGLQAYALGIAYEFDPYFGLSISRVDPLPHQLEAVYDYLLKLARVRTLARLRVRSAETGQRVLYGLPIGRSTNYLHVWKSLLEKASFTLEDIPKQWDAFWSFWCDRVQPEVREATGRDDIWGIALNMSGEAPGETDVQFSQFMDAYEADYVTRDGRLVIDDPEVRQKLIEAMNSYTAIYRKGCTPPSSVSWDNADNNRQFLAHMVVMTPNETLSIPNALKAERPDDYFENVATIQWPLGPDGGAFPIAGDLYFAVVFKGGGHVATAKDFIRFLLADGWLAHYLDFSAERFLPAMQALIDSPFWLDPSDRHRMAGVMQLSSRPIEYDYQSVSGDWRYGLPPQEHVWAKAVHRVAADGISPEQAIDEAIARIKQILNE